MIPAAILLAGLLLRIVAADSYWKWHDRAFPGAWEVSRLVLSHDGQQYIHQARPDTWRSAHPYYQEWERKPYYRPPLASYYFMYLFRASSFDRPAVSIVQSVLAVGAYLFLFLMARHLFSFRIALLSLLVLAFHPVLIFYDTSFEDSPPALFLLSLALSLVVRPQGRAWRRWVPPGILMGMTLLVRPNLAIIFPFLAVYLWLLEPGGRAGRTLQFSLPVLVLLSLPVWHNYRASGRLTFVTDTAGENLYWGNNAHPDYRITTQGFWRIPLVDYDNPARLLFDAIRENTGEQTLDRAFRAQVVSYVREKPLEAGYGLLRKAIRHLSNYEIPRNRNFSWLGTSSLPFRLPLVPYSILAGLALLGWVTVAPRSRPLLVLVAPWIAVFLAEVIFFNASRYRALGLPFLVPLAVAGAFAVSRELSRRRWSRSTGAVLLISLFYLAGRYCVPDGEKQSYLSASYYKAAMLEAYAGPDGEFRLISEDRFTENLRRSLLLDPANLDAFSMEVKYLTVAGRLQEADRLLREQRERCPGHDFLCSRVCTSLEYFLRHVSDIRESTRFEAGGGRGERKMREP